MSDTAAQIERLQSSVSQVQQMRGSALVSIAMMAVGVAVLVGGIGYTAAKITPLERRAEALRTANDQMERDGLAKRVELARATEALAAAQRQLDSINTSLRQLAGISTLSATAQTQVANALESGQRAELTVTAAAEQTAPTPTSRRESADVLIERLFDASSVVRLRAYDDLMAQHGSAPDLVPRLLRYASAHTDNANGIYNSLVVLNTVTRRQLAPHAAEVTVFLDRVEGLGPRIAARVGDVRGRLRRAAAAAAAGRD